MILRLKKWQILLADKDILSALDSRVSCWVKMKEKTCLNCKSNRLIEVKMMEETKMVLIRMVQKRSFRTVVKIMTSNGKS